MRFLKLLKIFVRISEGWGFGFFFFPSLFLLRACLCLLYFVVVTTFIPVVEQASSLV